MSDYHIPVLLGESLEGLNLQSDGVYVDLTFGGGGHSQAILDRLSPKGRLIGFDQDEDAWQNELSDPRFRLEKQNFKYATNILKYNQELPVDGVLADLGVSSHQFNAGDRGFSFRADAPLDMRMSSEMALTAAKVVNEYELDELVKVLREFGEVQKAFRVAQKIISTRELGLIQTTGQLEDVVKSCFGFKQQKKEVVKVFQALRIEVNQEMEALKVMLSQAADLVKVGGRLVVISYHSLEDRLVKNYMRSGSLDGEQEKDFFGKLIRPFKPIQSKPIIPTEQEIIDNPRSRSAKLRVAERI